MSTAYSPELPICGLRRLTGPLVKWCLLHLLLLVSEKSADSTSVCVD